MFIVNDGCIICVVVCACTVCHRIDIVISILIFLVSSSVIYVIECNSCHVNLVMVLIMICISVVNHCIYVTIGYLVMFCTHVKLVIICANVNLVTVLVHFVLCIGYCLINCYCLSM